MPNDRSLERTHNEPLHGADHVGGLGIALGVTQPSSQFKPWFEQTNDGDQVDAILSRESLRFMVDTLDQAIPEVLHLHLGDISVHKRRLMQLAQLCGRYDILPTRLTLADIVLTSAHPVAVGGFADVYTASYAGQDVALKRFRFMNSDQEKDVLSKERACREIVLCCRLKHDHILPFVGVDTSTFSSRLCLVTPWMANGTVDSYIKRKGLPGAEVHKLLLGVSCGLRYLHANHVVHGDIRCSNILISDDCRPLLADFGLSSISWGVASRTTTSFGSNRWNAPEIYSPEFKNHTPATDVYAFGCTCIEAYTGELPFFRDVPNHYGLFFFMAAGKRHRRPPVTEGDHRAISDEVWAFIEDCMCPNPAERPVLPDVVERLQTLLDPRGILSSFDSPVGRSALQTSTAVLRDDSMQIPDALRDALENLGLQDGGFRQPLVKPQRQPSPSYLPSHAVNDLGPNPGFRLPIPQQAGYLHGSHPSDTAYGTQPYHITRITRNLPRVEQGLIIEQHSIASGIIDHKFPSLQLTRDDDYT